MASFRGVAPVTGPPIGRPEPGTSLKLLEVEGVRGSRPCYPRVTDAVTCPSCPGNPPPSARSGPFNPGKECRQPLGNSGGECLGPDPGRPLFGKLLKLDGTCRCRCAPGAPPPGRHRHGGGPSQSERFRAGVNLPVVEERCLRNRWARSSGLRGPRSGGAVYGLFKKRPPPGRWSLWAGRARPRRCGKPSGELAAYQSGVAGFSTPPAGSTGLFTRRPPDSPPALGPSNAPSHPSAPAGVRTGPSGHRLPPPGSGPHAPGPPRSPPGDGPSPHPPSPGRSSGNRAAPLQSQARATGGATGCHGEASRPHG